MVSSTPTKPASTTGVPKSPIGSTNVTTSSASAAAASTSGTMTMIPPELMAVLNSLDAATTAASARPITMISSPNMAQLSGKAGAGVASSSSSSSKSSNRRVLDPIDFLNKHYTSEATFVSHLPLLRDSVGSRMDHLDDSISNALQRQSETAEWTRRHVQDAKASVLQLSQRIMQVQQKASQSERAVLEITRDMKRLDCAKRHLQRTITTLKQLHMLVNAVEQLRVASLAASMEKGSGSGVQRQLTYENADPFPDFRTAASLVDVIRLLLQHFEPYTAKVQPMRLLHNKVSELQNDLLANLVRGLRIVAFGVQRADELEGKVPPVDSQLTTRQRTHSEDDGDYHHDHSEDDHDSHGDHAHGELSTQSTKASLLQQQSEVPVMTPAVMRGGVLLIDALGEQVRCKFIFNFCEDHLRDYVKEFSPSSREQPKQQQEEKRVSSFKKQEKLKEDEEADRAALEKKKKASLDHLEKRFVWFREMVQKVDQKFPRVFPTHWNVQASLARHFLLLTKEHIMILLLDGPRKDPDAGNATILLKALQKTIIFEKDSTMWLQRECGTVFESAQDIAAKEAAAAAAPPESPDAKSGEDADFMGEEKTVPPLIGVASVAFENHMDPYIRLEEQSMDEQLIEALEDRTVDTRGERPVFISSTNLFVYIKGSITRCTALTKGNAFYLLCQAFKDSLRKYAQVLNGKLPQPVLITTAVAVGGISIPGSFGGKLESAQQSGQATYRLPSGEEVTVCHVISTCEYCADTVEALEDLIRDTIDDKYKSKIDMMREQETFHDITAKAIRVLVSGLTNRVETASKSSMLTTNWATWPAVGEESSYVGVVQEEIGPFVRKVRSLLPTSYFRSFCDKFATSFSEFYFDLLLKLKKINEAGSQQLQLDVSILKTFMLKLPVLEEPSRFGQKPVSTGSTIAPAMYTKMVQKQLGRIEVLLKLVGTPLDMLIPNFKGLWVGGTAMDFQTVLALKGLKRTEQAIMLEKFGVDPVAALKGATVGVTSATIVSEHVQLLQDQGSTVAAKVNSDLSQMRQKVDDFRKTFRTSST